MPAQPVHIQDRTPGTDAVPYECLADMVENDKEYHYCLAQKQSAQFPEFRGHTLRNLMGRNSPTRVGQKQYEVVTDQSVLGLVEDEDMVLLRCPVEDYRATLAKDMAWANSRVAPPITTQKEPDDVSPTKSTSTMQDYVNKSPAVSPKDLIGASYLKDKDPKTGEGFYDESGKQIGLDDDEVELGIRFGQE